MVSISRQGFLTTHAFEKQSKYLGSEMTAKQSYSALGPLPACPLGVELVHCDGNITVPPAREQVTPAAWEPGVLQVPNLNQTESKRINLGEICNLGLHLNPFNRKNLLTRYCLGENIPEMLIKREIKPDFEAKCTS